MTTKGIVRGIVSNLVTVEVLLEFDKKVKLTSKTVIFQAKKH